MNLGMFSDAGNKKVSALINQAKRNGLTYRQTIPLIVDLAKTYPDVLDTVVRANIYMRLHPNDKKFKEGSTAAFKKLHGYKFGSTQTHKDLVYNYR
jgi:hypothetical protein